MILKLSFLLLALTIAESRKPFFRKDYTYFEEYDAFYKLHYDTKEDFSTYDNAFMTCDDEGSQLFYPKLEGEWTVAKKLIASLVEPLPANATDILVGIHDEIGRGEFITVDGHSTPSPIQNLASSQDCVTMEIDTGLMDTEVCNSSGRSFICKKVDKRQGCPSIDGAYIYSKETQKCYKINAKLKTWSQAMYTCVMEGGLLAVVESSAESNIIREMLHEYNTNYFVGFRKVYPRKDLYTVKGQNLDDVFQRWYRNKDEETVHDCGAAFSYEDKLYTSTEDCQHNLAFVCEMAPIVEHLVSM